VITINQSSNSRWLVGQSYCGVTSPKGLFWVKIFSFIKKLPKFTQMVFELGENVAMVLFIGYYCNFPLQKLLPIKVELLGDAHHHDSITKLKKKRFVKITKNLDSLVLEIT